MAIATHLPVKPVHPHMSYQENKERKITPRMSCQLQRSYSVYGGQSCKDVDERGIHDSCVKQWRKGLLPHRVCLTSGCEAKPLGIQCYTFENRIPVLIKGNKEFSIKSKTTTDFSTDSRKGINISKCFKDLEDKEEWDHRISSKGRVMLRRSHRPLWDSNHPNIRVTLSINVEEEYFTNLASKCDYCVLENATSTRPTSIKPDQVSKTECQILKEAVQCVSTKTDFSHITEAGILKLSLMKLENTLLLSKNPKKTVDIAMVNNDPIDGDSDKNRLSQNIQCSLIKFSRPSEPFGPNPNKLFNACRLNWYTDEVEFLNFGRMRTLDGLQIQKLLSSEKISVVAIKSYIEALKVVAECCLVREGIRRDPLESLGTARPNSLTSNKLTVFLTNSNESVDLKGLSQSSSKCKIQDFGFVLLSNTSTKGNPSRHNQCICTNTLSNDQDVEKGHTFIILTERIQCNSSELPNAAKCSASMLKDSLVSFSDPIGSIWQGRRSEEPGRIESVEIEMMSDDQSINEEVKCQNINGGIHCSLSEVVVWEDSGDVNASKICDFDKSETSKAAKLSSAFSLQTDGVSHQIDLNHVLKSSENSMNSNCPKTEFDVSPIPFTSIPENTLMPMTSSYPQANHETEGTIPREGIRCSTDGMPYRPLSASTARNSSTSMDELSGLVDINILIDSPPNSKEADYKLSKAGSETLFGKSSVNSAVKANSSSTSVNLASRCLTQQEKNEKIGISESSQRLNLTLLKPKALIRLPTAMPKSYTFISPLNAPKSRREEPQNTSTKSELDTPPMFDISALRNSSTPLMDNRELEKEEGGSSALTVSSIKLEPDSASTTIYPQSSRLLHQTAAVPRGRMCNFPSRHKSTNTPCFGTFIKPKPAIISGRNCTNDRSGRVYCGGLSKGLSASDRLVKINGNFTASMSQKCIPCQLLIAHHTRSSILYSTLATSDFRQVDCEAYMSFGGNENKKESVIYYWDKIFGTAPTKAEAHCNEKAPKMHPKPCKKNPLSKKGASSSTTIESLSGGSVF